jgi:hypothetical protein
MMVRVHDQQKSCAAFGRSQIPLSAAPVYPSNGRTHSPFFPLPELRKIRPEVKVVVSSGYSEAETMTLFKGQRVSGFIKKPYTSKGLAKKVKVCVG